MVSKTGAAVPDTPPTTEEGWSSLLGDFGVGLGKVQMQEFYASMLYVRRNWDDMPWGSTKMGTPRSCVSDADARVDNRVTVWRVAVPSGTPGACQDPDDGLFYVANDNLWFLNARKLFEQFLCTASARCELKRMDTLSSPMMQKQCRAETYTTLKEAISAGTNLNDVGKKVICPASVKGSRRAMQKLFLDCMAIVRKYGSPHLFITVTCNQGHREIRVSTASEPDRADIVGRYFAKQVVFWHALLRLARAALGV